MALDTRSKRASSAGLLLPFLLSPVLPDGSISQGDRQHSAYTYSGIAAASAAPTIEDPDDLSVTARVDADGATIRPARLVISHAADGERDADLVGHDRMATIDRHRARSSREARTPNLGSRFLISLQCARAGEAFALRRLVTEVSDAGENSPHVQDATTRTDPDGCTAKVPALSLSVAADGEREADLSTIGASVQDRWLARFAIPDGQGLGQRFLLSIEEAGAGNSWALGRLVSWVSDEADAKPPEET